MSLYVLPEYIFWLISQLFIKIYYFLPQFLYPRGGPPPLARMWQHHRGAASNILTVSRWRPGEQINPLDLYGYRPTIKSFSILSQGITSNTAFCLLYPTSIFFLSCSLVSKLVNLLDQRSWCRCPSNIRCSLYCK